MLCRFLAAFNKRFAVPATEASSAYRPLAAGFRAEEVFCFTYARAVGADNTAQFAGQRLQLLAGPTRLSYARTPVKMRERLDGSVAVYHHCQCLATRPAPAEAPFEPDHVPTAPKADAPDPSRREGSGGPGVTRSPGPRTDSLVCDMNLARAGRILPLETETACQASPTAF